MNIPAITSSNGLPASENQARVAELTANERARATQLRGAGLRNASPAEQRAAVSAQFEAVLVRQLLGKTVTSMLGSGNAASSIYGDLLTDTFAQKLTSGSGMGLARVIEKQLTPRAPVSADPASSAT